MPFAEGIQAIENDELDVVVGLLQDEVDEARASGLDRSRVLGERRECRGSFILDGVR